MSFRRLDTYSWVTDDGTRVLVPRRLLLLRNMSSLFVSEAMGVVIGSCLQQMLVGMLFLVVFRQTSYMRDPELLHSERLRILSPASQIAAYGGVWALLVIYDSLVALFVQRRLMRATSQLVDSMYEGAHRHQPVEIKSPTGMSEMSGPKSEVGSPTRKSKKDEDETVGAELDVEREGESLLDRVREDLAEARFGKEKRIEGVDSLSESSSEEGEPRLEINVLFMKYVGWQVISRGFTCKLKDDISTLEQDNGTLEHDIGTLEHDIGTLVHDIGTTSTKLMSDLVVKPIFFFVRYTCVGHTRCR